MSLLFAMMFAFMLRSVLAASEDACVAFGKDGLAELHDCRSIKSIEAMQLTESYNGTVNWAIEIPGVGMALCDTANNAIKLWKGTGKFVDIPLGQLSKPSGAVFLDGLLYVACFGSNDLSVTSGLAIVNPATETLVSTHTFPGDMHVHNAYAMDWAGRAEIFVAVLGNPWAKPPVTGRGLVLFDREHGTFVEDTTSTPMNVRSAKQQSDGAVYTLSQEPNAAPSVLSRLVKKGANFVIDAQVELPKRADGGSGGADVVLGRDLDTVFASDRTAAAGKLYYYTFSADGFQLRSSHDTGKNPRYTVVLDDGDVVVCNQDDATLSVFEGLAIHPLQTTQPRIIRTVNTVMFFVQRRLGQNNTSPLSILI